MPEVFIGLLFLWFVREKWEGAPSEGTTWFFLVLCGLSQSAGFLFDWVLVSVTRVGQWTVRDRKFPDLQSRSVVIPPSIVKGFVKGTHV